MADKKTKKGAEKKGYFANLGEKFKGLKGEFKKITWASSKSTFKNFGIVMTIVIISAVVIGFIDWGLGSFFDFLLNVLPDIG